LICETYEERMRGMRGAKIKEHVCPACNGTGYPVVTHPVQPGRKIYPAKCKTCGGSGKGAEMIDVARSIHGGIELGLKAKK
jgi:DnaJ-class molecular chaperone